MKSAKNLKKTVLTLLCLSVLGGCSFISNKSKRSVIEDLGLSQLPKPLLNDLIASNEQARGGLLNTEQRVVEQKESEVFKRSLKPWIGAKIVPVREQERLSEDFYENIVFNHVDLEPSWTLDTLVIRLSQMTRIPIRITPDAYRALHERYASSGSVIPTIPDISDVQDDFFDTDLPAVPEENTAKNEKNKTAETNKKKDDIVQNVKFSPALFKWSGSLKGFLDLICDRLDLNWSNQDGTVVISRYAMESFEIAMFPFNTSYSMRTNTADTSRVRNTGGKYEATGPSGQSGGGGGGGGTPGTMTSNITQNFEEQGNLSYFKSVVDIIRKLIEPVPGSELFIADGSGRVVVKTSKTVLSQIRDFVKSENTAMLKQAVVQIDIYSITSELNNGLSVNWGTVYTKLLKKMGASLQTPKSLLDGEGGFFSVNLKAGADASLVIDTLNKEGFTVQHRPISLIAMNRQWARKARLSVQNYLAETVPAPAGALGGGGGLPGLKPGNVTVGDQISVLPFILENNTVLLKFGFSFSDLLKLDAVTSGQDQNSQSLQIPATSSLSDLFTVAVRPGETMAITGLTRDMSKSERNGIAEGASILLSGSEKQKVNKEQYLLFLRVVLL